MDFKPLIEARYSVRKYKPEILSDELLNEVLDAGRMAPTAVNKQPFVFVVVNDPDKLKQLHEAYSRDWFSQVLQVIVICGDHKTAWKRSVDGKDHTDIDLAIATDHMTLRATELELGTCWVCNFDPAKVSKTLNLPGHLEPAVLLPIGRPEEVEAPPKRRKTLSEMVVFNGY
ncbi:nitroreductase family protein [Marinilabilia rubra]|uniref:Nitroreductase n=1 Tax=Marinilabilia rubra TaxID=2162893 RepID=A0A2U2B4B5_9BACT|nr:nitroreductase family protein [Marinilabilia rubra]PWD97899.1 nitroreductase [Marinilabilia rubra]